MLSFFFSPRKSADIKTKRPFTRNRLGFESLENRELLSVSPLLGPVLSDASETVIIDASRAWDEPSINETSASVATFAAESSDFNTLAAAPTIGLSGGTLRIDGTAGDDWVEVKLSGSVIYVYGFAPDGSSQTTLASYGSGSVSTIEFYGNAGNDVFKNWSSITSTIDGGDGNNLLLGGTGTNTFYNTGLGSNCFVWRGSDDKWAAGSSNDSAGKDDAQLCYYTHRNSPDPWASCRAWKDAEIETTLGYIQDVYRLMGNYMYFRNDPANNFSNSPYYNMEGTLYLFITDRTGTGINGANVSDSYPQYIYFNAPDGFVTPNESWKRTFIHEFGHNWNSLAANPFFEKFVAVSWTGTPDAFGSTYRYTKKTDSNDGDFSRNYGQTNSDEDWTTTLEKVLVDHVDGDRPTERWLQKVEIVHQFLNWLGESKNWGQSSMVVTTDLDVVDPFDGVISLREAIIQAGPNATITFANDMKGKTIELNGTALETGRALTIDGSGMNITIDAGSKSGIFGKNRWSSKHLEGDGVDFTVIGLTLTGATGFVSRAQTRLCLIDSTVVGNFSELGSGSYLFTGNVQMKNTTVAGNRADTIFEQDMYYTVTITNSRIIGNEVGLIGNSGWKSMTINNSTIVGNTGLFRLAGASHLTVNNSILVDNDGSFTLLNTARVTINASMVDRIPTNRMMFTIDSNSFYATIGTSIDPKFVGYSSSTAWNTWDLHLRADSPALGKGKAELIPNGIVTDLEGNSRHTLGSVDMGAYQHTYVVGSLPADGDFGSTSSVSSVKLTGATLAWTKPVGYTPVSGLYDIYVKVNDPNVTAWKKVVSTTTLSCGLLNLQEGTDYEYRIEARILGIPMVLTSGSFSTLKRVAAPSGLSVTVNPVGNFIFQWNDNSDDEAGFELQKSIDGGKTWITVSGSIAANATSFVIDRPELMDYQFRLRSKNAAGNSLWSETIQLLKTEQKPEVPGNLRSVWVSWASHYLAMTWNAVAGADYYRVERYDDETGSWTKIYTGTATSFTDTTTDWDSTYRYRVSAVNDFGDSGSTPELEMTSHTEPEPHSPAYATLQSDNKSVAISWDGIYGTTSYVVERSTDGVTWKKIATVKAADSYSGGHYTDKSLKPATTYYYRVTSSNMPTPEGWTAKVVTRTTAPAAPTVKTIDAETISVSWKAVSGATGYTVLRRLGFDPDEIGWVEVDLTAATLKGSTYTVVDAGVEHNTEYIYAVVAKGITEEFDSSLSTEKTIRTGPHAPQYVTYGNVTDKTLVLSWQSTYLATSYKVEKYYNGKWSSAGTTKATELTVKSLKAGQTYVFRIVAISNQFGKSVAAETLPIMTLASTPKAPTLKTVDSNSVNVTWSRVKEATGYIVQRTLNGVNEWEDVVTITDNPKKPAYVDTGLQPNTAYQYRIIALGFLETSDSLPSKDSKTVTTAPAAPENLTVTKTEHNLAVLTWDVVPGATSYKVEKYVNGKWSSAGTSKTTQITVKSLKPTTEYQFRVVAVNKAGKSTPTVTENMTTKVTPPTAPTLKTLASDSVSVVWKAVTGAIGYLVQRSVAGSDDWTAVPGTPTTSKTTMTLIDTGLAANTVYSYRIIALGSAETLNSTPTVSKKTVTTAPATPENFAAKSVASNSIVLSWNTAPGATSYKIEKYVNGKWSSAGTSKTGELTIRSLKPSTNYVYRIVAVSSAGCSTPSSELTVTTESP